MNAPETDLSFLSLANLIRRANAASSKFKIATAVAGLAALVITVLRFGVNSATLVFGIIILLFLGVLFVVFTQVPDLAKSRLTIPATLLVYSAMLLAILTAGALFASAFLNTPLPLKDIIIRSWDPAKPTMSAEEADKLGLTLWVGPNANPQEAFKYFQIAADQDYPVAFGQMGWMYELGRVPGGPNCTRAMELYRKAYEKGALNTSWNIGRLYDLGCGVKQDDTLARCWYEKAKANGLYEARRDLDKMEQEHRLTTTSCPAL
jgi:hypothetical protein